jgi:PTH1 family peptidyl-tRNA hydrolase
MRLLVGLGNPGAEYARNRHNIGFMAVDEIVRRHSFAPWKSKFKGAITEGEVAGERVLALKPATYMNASGESVADAARFYKIAIGDVFLLHDELDLGPGKVRVKKDGGAAGHNGLRSVAAHLGSETWRVRLGIGHPGDRDLVMPWVLGDFAKADRDWLGPMLEAVAAHFPSLLNGDENGFMSRVAHDAPAPRIPARGRPEPGAAGQL